MAKNSLPSELDLVQQPSYGLPDWAQRPQAQTVNTGGAVPFQAEFLSASQKYGVPFNVLMGLAEQESSFNPTAIGVPTKYGRAKGLMQYIDDTASRMGINPYDPVQSIDAAARQLRERLDKGYSMQEAVQAHFGGDDRAQWGPKTAQYGKDVLGRAEKFLGNGQTIAAGQPTQQQDQPQTRMEQIAQDYPPAQSAMENLEQTRQRTQALLDEMNKEEPGRYRPLTDEEMQQLSQHITPEMQQQAMQSGKPIEITIPDLVQPGQAVTPQQSVTQKKPEGNKDGNLFTDALALLDSGFNTAAKDVQELVGKIPYIGKPIVDAADRFDRWANGKSSQELFKAYDESVERRLSPEMLAARRKSFVIEPGDDLGDGKKSTGYNFGPAWSDPRAYMSGILESLPEMALTMGGSGRLAQMAYRRALASGASREVAAKAAARTATVAGGILEGGLSGAQSSREVREDILKMKPEQLANSDAMKSLMDGGLSFEQARAQLAENASSQAFMLAGISTGIFGGMGDRALAKIITNRAGGRVKAALAGALGEGVFEEMPQSATQQMSQNYAMQQADPNTPLMKGVANQAAAGLAVGGLMGAGMGAAAPRVGTDEQPAATQEQQPAQPVQAEQAQPAAQPEQTVQAEQPQEIKPSGPLARALQAGVQQTTEDVAAQAQQNTAAAENHTPDEFMGPVGAETMVIPSDDPESAFPAVVQEYRNGNAVVADQNGEILEFGPHEVVRPDAAADIVQQQPAQAVNEPVQQQIPVEQAIEEQPRQPKAVSEMTEPELRDRLKYLHQQAKSSGGWNERLTKARREVEKAIDAKTAPVQGEIDAETTNLPDERAAQPEVSQISQPDNAPAVQSDESGSAAQLDRVAPVASESGTGRQSDVLPVSGSANADPTLNKDGSQKWFGTERKANEYLQKKGITGTHEIRLVDRRFEIHAKGQDGTLTNEGTTEKAAPPKGKNGPRYNRVKKLLGAEEGDIVTPQEDIGYATAGRQYRIDQIEKNGIVHLTNLETNGGTTVSLGELERAKSRKSGFNRVESVAEPAPAAQEQQQSAPQNTSSADKRIRDGMVESGERLLSASGRELSPAPKIDTTGPGKLNNSSKRLNNWMYEEALKEARETGNNWNETLLRAIDPNRMSQSDQDTLNSLLFGDPDGPTERNRTGNQQPAPETAKSEPKTAETATIQPKTETAQPKSAEYGASNKLVSQDRAAELRKKLKAKFSQLNSGLDPEILAIGTELAVFHLEAGVRKFADFARTMASDLDVPLNRLRPYLRSWYNGGRDMMEDSNISIEGMDSPDTVRAELAKLDDNEATAAQPKAEASDPKSSDDSDKQPRYQLFNQATGGGSNAEFMSWVSDMKSEYTRARGIDNSAPGGATINDQADFTNFIREKVNAERKQQSRPTGAMDDMVSQFDNEVTPNVSGIRTGMEPDSRNAADAVSGNENPVLDGSGRNNRSDEQPGQRTEQERSVGQRDQRVSADGAASRREPGNQPVHQPNGQFVAEGRDAGNSERSGSRGDSQTGSPVEQQRRRAIVDNAHAAGAGDLDSRLKAQKAAKGAPTTWADKASIDAALPLLLPEQRGDVLKIEQRHQVATGVLSTNGTGTGKTATGLGAAKRFYNAGKKNIAIVVPTDKVASDWVKFAGMMDMPLRQLSGIDDAGGSGPIVTTYANFGQNDALYSRQWDLIIPDESHYLSSNANGDSTAALDKLRGLTGHPDGFQHWLIGNNKALHEEMTAENAILAKMNTSQNGYQAQEQKVSKLLKQWGEIREPAQKEWQQRWTEQRDLPKVVFLSATPFAYVKNTDYAEGYLFHHTPPAERYTENSTGGYNSANDRERFYMEHFGYRMRYNKLTQPEAGVNTELMEQNFNQWLKDTGALFGRRLDVPFDYDRRFQLIDDAAGKKLDDALRFLNEAENGIYRPIYDEVMRTFDYQRRMFLLESMKARAAVPVIREHLKLGRKVVVFHDYNQGGGFSPFAEALAEMKDLDMRSTASELFQRPIFRINFSGLDSAINTIKKAFPNVLLFNGTVSKGKRRQNADFFNADNSGKNLILVQSDAGREGVSLHDTTGKHQRVEINLGMPVRPVAATQIEGRIYRTGQASDAIFRYMTTGTSWEASTFASKIAERAATAENLALGEEARGLKQSFIDAYNEAEPMQASREDGKGGKERDQALSQDITPFDKAKTFYWAQQKNTKRRDQREGQDYFASPEPVGLKMVEWANIKPGDKVLEPSAGHGAIARFFPAQSDVTMVEPSYDLSQRAALANGTARIINGRFEDLSRANKFDAIVMNPPFGTGGKTAYEHLAKAAKHLRQGGRLVALVPRGGISERRFDQFFGGDEAKGLDLVARIKMPWVTFERAGTKVATEVLVFERHDKSDGSIIPVRIDLSSAQTINELFDRIEGLTLPERQPLTADEAIANAADGTMYSVPGEVVSHQTDTPAFKRWFEGSKVVDENGNPQVMYHGTPEDFTVFNTADRLADGSARNPLNDNIGAFFTSDRPDAEDFSARNASSSAASNIHDVYLAIKNPLVFEDQAEFRSYLRKNSREDMEKAGYDGVIINDVYEEDRAYEFDPDSDEYLNGPKTRWAIAFSPEQVKSASRNNGNFDSSNPDIRFSIAAAKESLTEGSIGSAAKELLDAGRLELHSAPPAPEFLSAGGWIDPDGKIHLALYNLRPEDVQPTLMHELFHAGMRNIGGDRRWVNLMDRLGQYYRAAQNGGAKNEWTSAVERIQNAQRQGDRMNDAARDHVIEELGAYAVENFEKMPAGIRKWAESIIGAVKNYLQQTFGLQLGKVTPGQLRALAAGAIRNQKAPATSTAFSTPESSQPPKAAEKQSWFNQRWDEVADLPDNMLKTVMPALLRFTPGRFILKRVGKDIPALGRYADVKLQMDTLRDEWHAKTDQESQKWLKYRVSKPQENAELMSLMHDSTLAQVDPSKDFQSILNAIDLTALREKKRGDPAWDEANQKAQDDAKRKEEHGKLRERYNALSPEGKQIYNRVRDLYSRLADAQEQAIIDNMEKAMDIRSRQVRRKFEDEMQRITDEGLKGKDKEDAMAAAKKALNNGLRKDAWNRRARINQLRSEFESNRLAGPYFPLARFGDFFVTARKKGSGEVVSFSRTETAFAQTRLRKQLEKEGYVVETGIVSKSNDLRKQVPADFVARIEDLLKGIEGTQQTQDQVWQLYLQTMPDYSLRKSRIHRKGRAGFEEDALRAFASHMFHGSHQLARMKYSMELGDLIDQAEREAKRTRSPVRSGLVVEQARMNHDYVMNPTSNRISQVATQGAFMWYLAQSPAAALVNMSQTFIVAPAKLAAFYDKGAAAGIPVALGYLNRAMFDLGMGRTFAEKSARVTPEEKRAVSEAYRMGLITRTQSHDVAGIGDSGVKYSPIRAKLMAALSFMFHHTERINREATFLAAYRMAKKRGLDPKNAIRKAADLTWDSHYDYQNSSRPAIMHSNTGKALLVFRNYSLNMLADLAYTAYEMVNPRNKQERREARTQMLGLGATLAFNAGIRGLPLYGLLMAIAGMFSDDGEDPEVELKKTMLQHFPKQMVGIMMDGVPGYLSGVELSGRIGFGDLWFRSDDMDREGDAQFLYWLQQVLGASAGIPYNWYRGVSQINDGYTWRGIETMVPKAIKDPMKAWRYYNEGVSTKNGDPIVDDVGGWNIFKQAMGFNPAKVTEQYKMNSYNMNKQKAITEERSKLLGDFYKAWKAGDEKKVDQITDKMREYSEKYPEMRIDAGTVRSSLSRREKYRGSALGGMNYNQKLVPRLQDEQPGTVYR